jgi:hypothetical protein
MAAEADLTAREPKIPHVPLIAGLRAHRIFCVALFNEQLHSGEPVGTAGCTPLGVPSQPEVKSRCGRPWYHDTMVHKSSVVEARAAIV